MTTEEQPRHTYPDKLIKQCQEVISKRSGANVTKDKAELYLDKFARLMKVTIEIMEQVEEKERIRKTKSKTASIKP